MTEWLWWTPDMTPGTPQGLTCDAPVGPRRREPRPRCTNRAQWRSPIGRFYCTVHKKQMERLLKERAEKETSRDEG